MPAPLRISITIWLHNQTVVYEGGPRLSRCVGCLPVWLDGLQPLTRAAFGPDSLDFHSDTSKGICEPGRAVGKSEESATQFAGTKDVESRMEVRGKIRTASLDFSRMALSME